MSSCASGQVPVNAVIYQKAGLSTISFIFIRAGNPAIFLDRIRILTKISQIKKRINPWISVFLRIADFRN